MSCLHTTRPTQDDSNNYLASQTDILPNVHFKSSKSPLNLFFWNVQGICNKIDYISLLCSDLNINVLAVAEHWAGSADASCVQVPGFCNASFYTRPSRIHGGAALFVREGIDFVELPHIKNMSVEMVCEVAAIELVNVKLTVLSIYRPYNNDVVYFNNFMGCLYTILGSVFQNNHNLVICADFNVQFSSGRPNNFEIDLRNMFRCFGLEITTTDITRPGIAHAGTCIDNVVTDIHHSNWKSQVIHTILSDHNGIHFSVNLNKAESMNKFSGKKVLFRSINESKINLFLQLLNSINWLDVYSVKQTKDKFKKFLELFLWAVNGAFPLITSNKKYYKPRNAWYNNNLRLLKGRCDDLYWLTRKCDNTVLKNRYLDAKKIYKSAVNKAKTDYYTNIIDQSQNKSKTLWTVVNRLSNSNCRHSETSSKISSDGFNNFFIDHISSVTGGIPSSMNDFSDYLINFPVPKLNFIFQQVSVQKMYQHILNLSNSKCLDIYGINSMILKIAASVICEVLTVLFNDCLVGEGYFPSELKNIKVVPVFKSGDKQSPSNYRPISIVPIVSKLFESILHEQISGYFESNNIFTDKQFGFRPSRSTGEAVLRLVDGVIKNVETGNHVMFRSYDMSKAFDTIQHNTLKEKLYYYGISTSSVSLISSYLSSRTQYVFKDGLFSKGRLVEYGVPQGSILGPILFNIYINDLPINIDSQSNQGFLFADDFGLRVACKNKEEADCCLKNCSEVLKDWCSVNNLSMNIDKIADIRFTYNRKVAGISNLSSLKFLGIWLDFNLSWISHIDYITNKIAKGIYLLRRFSFTVNSEALLKIYFAYIYSLMSYGLILWGCSTHTQKVFLFQKKAVRVICKVPFNTPCRPLFKKLRILTLPSLHILLSLCYVHNNKEKFQQNSDFHHHDTRSKNEYRIQQYQYKSSQNNWFYFSTKLYNRLPNSVKILPPQSFKSKLKKILISECLYKSADYWDIKWELYCST